MGGRRERREDVASDDLFHEAGLPEREQWIGDVSSERLDRYERMLSTPGAGHRLDGSSRGDGGSYFLNLIERERARRSRVEG